MAVPRLWNQYALARHTFELDPSPKNEGAVIAAYSEWVRGFAPEDAAECISLLCRHLAWFIDRKRVA